MPQAQPLDVLAVVRSKGTLEPPVAVSGRLLTPLCRWRR